MIKGNSLYIALYFAMFAIHFLIFKSVSSCCETVFLRYYLFLTLLFMMVLTLLSLVRRLYPQYIGFGSLGLVMVKLIVLFIAMKRLGLEEVPNYKLHFAFPYLVSLVLETLYAIKLIKSEELERGEKDEKNQQTPSL